MYLIVVHGFAENIDLRHVGRIIVDNAIPKLYFATWSWVGIIRCSSGTVGEEISIIDGMWLTR